MTMRRCETAGAGGDVRGATGPRETGDWPASRRGPMSLICPCEIREISFWHPSTQHVSRRTSIQLQEHGTERLQGQQLRGSSGGRSGGEEVEQLVTGRVPHFAKGQFRLRFQRYGQEIKACRCELN